MSPLALSLRLLQTQPDERLLTLARGGHEPAFEALVRRYRRQLLAYCRRLVPQEVNAEDVLQQALMQAWRALGAGVAVRDARPWLYRIVHNAAVSAARAVGEAPAELARAIPPATVEQLVEQRMAAREALAGLAALPELQREAMLGTALEGLSHEQIADALGLTSGSVRGLIYRARATLRAAAAALTPGPLAEWAARQQPAAHAGSAAVLEAVTGGGSAGLAGAVLKGGAVVTVAGALAGTAAVVVTHRPPARYGPARAHAAPLRGAGAAKDLLPAATSAAPDARYVAATRSMAPPTHAGTPTTVDDRHTASHVTDRSRQSEASRRQPEQRQGDRTGEPQVPERQQPEPASGATQVREGSDSRSGSDSPGGSNGTSTTPVSTQTAGGSVPAGGTTGPQQTSTMGNE